uniref:acyltransferase family protein n=1 Tax=Novosphingobium rosa TaxID=76978 RepID=UPI00082C582C
MTTAARGYIASITGLRAIAVLSIVLYHVNARWMPGGFVGVDVFFVISGFVVAHSVTSGRHESFGAYLGWFFKRRFQRILPAAWLYIAVAILLDMLVIPRTQATHFFELTGAAAAFGQSNIVLFAKSGDYFAVSSELNPFTHTWSLAVEEQYYLLFPFFSYVIFASARASQRTARIALGLVGLGALVSLAAAAYMTRHNPTFAFYMIPTRFWELASGFLLRVGLGTPRGVAIGQATTRWRDLLAVAVLAVLGFSLVHTDPLRFPFPGALAPCLATLGVLALVWWHPDHWLDRALSMRLPLWFGDISYSLYLWHWGVIVALRWTCGIDTLPAQLFAGAAMLLLAWLSYRYVEKAFHNQRHRRSPPSLRFFVSYGVAGCLVAAICVAGFAGKPRLGLAAADNLALWDPYGAPPLPPGCPTTKHIAPLGAGMDITFPTPCTKPDARRLFIMGDSHAGAYQRTAWRLAAEGRWQVHLLTMGGCRMVSIVKLPDRTACDNFLVLAQQRIVKLGKPGDVVVLPGLQTTRYLTGEGQPLAPRPLDPATIALSRQRVTALTALGMPVIVEGAKPLVS